MKTESDRDYGPIGEGLSISKTATVVANRKDAFMPGTWKHVLQRSYSTYVLTCKLKVNYVRICDCRAGHECMKSEQ